VGCRFCGRGRRRDRGRRTLRCWQAAPRIKARKRRSQVGNCSMQSSSSAWHVRRPAMVAPGAAEYCSSFEVHGLQQHHTLSICTQVLLAPCCRAQEWWDDEEGAEAVDGERPASAKRSRKQRGQQAPAARNWWESDDEEAANGSGANPGGTCLALCLALPASSTALFQRQSCAQGTDTCGRNTRGVAAFSSRLQPRRPEASCKLMTHSNVCSNGGPGSAGARR
jgi:hypothetical protein